MPRSNADLLAIKAELTNDPATLGLTVLAADDEANAGKLNLSRVTISIRKRSLATAAIFNATSPLEYQAMTEQQRTWFNAMLTLNQIDPFLAVGVVNELRTIFPENTTSRAAIDPLFVQQGNRIDQLFQLGTLAVGGTVTPSEIAQARNAV